MMTSTFWDSYKDLTTHIVPGPNSISYFIPFILLPLALLIPPSRLSKSQLSILFLPLSWGCFFHSCLYGGGLDVVSFSAILWGTDLLAFQDCRRTFKRIHLKKQPTPEHSSDKSLSDSLAKPTANLYSWEGGYPTSLRKRIPWVLTLIISIRLGYWKTADPMHNKHQPPTPMTRIVYLRHCGFLILTSYVLLDTAAFAATYDAYFHDPTISISTSFDTPISALPIFVRQLQALPPRFARSTLLAAHFYSIISLGGALTTPLPLLPNALGIIPDTWSPQSWPLFFGPFSSVLDRGLRGLWGTWWHQTTRYLLNIPGMALSHVMKLKEGGRGDYLCRTTTAFAASGLVHMGLVPPEPRWATRSAWTIRAYIAGFFWLQAVGIAVEVLVFDGLRLMGLSEWVSGWRRILRRVVVLAWVIFWLCWTLPILGVGVRELGYGRVYPIPISLWMGLTSSRWAVWPG